MTSAAKKGKSNADDRRRPPPVKRGFGSPISAPLPERATRQFEDDEDGPGGEEGQEEDSFESRPQ